ncbi:MAG: amidohydrolase family protein [Streptosporangiaceae bacterium]
MTASGPAGPALAGRPAAAGPDLVALCGGTVVTSLDPPQVAVADLVLAGDRVAAVGAAPDGAVRRDATGTLIVPGLACAHHHLYSALARGMPLRLAPPADFTEILQRVWWRLDRALDEDSIRASALTAGLEALLAGTTTIVDHHASPNAIDGSLDIIAGALASLGLRCVLCYEVSDRDGPQRARAGIAENLRFLAAGRPPLARGMMGAHASFTMSDETLAACADAARQAGTGIHVHVAEDAADNRDAVARCGRTAAARLHHAGVITGQALLAHCVHVAPPEIDLIGMAGATVACNPRSNMNNAVGSSAFTLRPGRVALGTDGIGGDMIGESQAGFFRAREMSLDTPPDWPLARLAAGSAFAGRAFGEPLLGTLAPGAPADLVVLDYPAPAPLTAAGLAGHWVFGLTGARVRDVYVAGDQVVIGGRSARVDQAALAAGSCAQAARLWERLERIAPHPYAPGGRRIR